MPRKGLPRCKCGAYQWSLVKANESSAVMKCRSCLGVTKTRSVRGIRILKGK